MRFVKYYAKIAIPLNDLLVGHYSGFSVQDNKRRIRVQSLEHEVLPSKQHLIH